jgi:hypothetical protein
MLALWGMAAPTLEHADAVMEEISTLFEVNRMGDTEDFLGLQIVGDCKNRRVYIYQERYTEKIRHSFTDGKVNPVNTPWPF